MEMLQLRYFYESAMEESFSKTARKYMVPVSSVSASVKRLEQELGVELFTRTGNRILLTEKGKQFLTVVGVGNEKYMMSVRKSLRNVYSIPFFIHVIKFTSIKILIGTLNPIYKIRNQDFSE